jgi:hypothetical protein
MIGSAKIVLRYANGKTLKGYSQDYSPASPHFHVRPNEAIGSDPGQQVSTHSPQLHPPLVAAYCGGQAAVASCVSG